MFKEKKVIVTGANGFIATHLIEELLKNNARVIGFTSTKEKNKFKDKIELLEIINKKQLQSAIKNINPDYVFHLASAIELDRDTQKFEYFIEKNVLYTLHLLQALENTDVKRVIITGTCEEYGKNKVPFTEDQKTNPVSPYGFSKATITNLATSFYNITNLPITIIRPFLTYGPHKTNDMIVPYAIKKAINNENIEITSGEQTRDLIYVKDVVSGYLKAALSDKSNGEIFNLGSAIPIKIIDLVKKIKKLSNSKSKIIKGAIKQRTAPLMEFHCSNKKAKKVLNWQPKYTLEQGLKETIDWFKENKHE